jgi:predicted dehydrogenase
MRFAVVGAGTIGQLRAQTIRANPATELAGVLDVAQANAAKAAAGTGARVCQSLEQLLELPGLEAVIVSSPLQFHEQAVVAALRAGKHVLCEKPLGNTVDSCRRMLDAARASGKRLATGFNHRYYPSIKFLKRAIDEGQIGTLDHVRVFGGHDGLHNFRADWQYKAPESGGGAMMDVGIHMTDLARYILGDVTEVYGVSSNHIWKVPGSEDNAVAVFRSPSGIPATYEATWTEWKGYRFYVEAYGDCGHGEGLLRADVQSPGYPGQAGWCKAESSQTLSGNHGAGKAQELDFDRSALVSGRAGRFPSHDQWGDGAARGRIRRLPRG